MNLSLVVLGVLVGLALLGIWAATLVWVYRDAEDLGKPGLVVALLVGLVCWPVGLLVWLILRGDYVKTPPPAPMPPLACPRCGRVLAADAAHGLCPVCLLQQAAISESGPPSPAGFAPPSVAELAPLFPQLEILELLGRGGMGAVYKARQPGLDRFVALKILPATTGADPAFTERFGREARALAALNHPHIVNVYDFGQTAALSWLLMEYVDGVNLRQLQQTGRLSPREALAIVPQVCEALQFAHDRGIIHRDIKPENILVDKQGQVKIADFGLAKLMRPDAGGIALTQTRQAVGTPHYMAPEQVERPQSVDHRADIYSLGVVFYEMLTGELPMGRFPVPSQRVQVDVRLDEVVLKALEKQPERRYQQASAFKTRIETMDSAAEQTPATTRPAEPGATAVSAAESAGEPILKEGGASLQQAVETVGGWLKLTARQLIFTAHELNIQGGTTTIAVADIVSIQPGWSLFLGFIPLLPNVLVIQTRDGKTYRFVLWGRDVWAAAIKRQTPIHEPQAAARARLVLWLVAGILLVMGLAIVGLMAVHDNFNWPEALAVVACLAAAGVLAFFARGPKRGGLGALMGLMFGLVMVSVVGLLGAAFWKTINPRIDRTTEQSLSLVWVMKRPNGTEVRQVYNLSPRQTAFTDILVDGTNRVASVAGTLQRNQNGSCTATMVWYLPSNRQYDAQTTEFLWPGGGPIFVRRFGDIEVQVALQTR